MWNTQWWTMFLFASLLVGGFDLLRLAEAQVSDASQQQDTILVAEAVAKGVARMVEEELGLDQDLTQSSQVLVQTIVRNIVQSLTGDFTQDGQDQPEVDNDGNEETRPVQRSEKNIPAPKSEKNVPIVPETGKNIPLPSGEKNAPVPSGEEHAPVIALQPPVPEELLKSGTFTLSNSDRCRLYKYAGPCRALIKLYAFDREKKACEPFDFGGCPVNLDKLYFSTKEECEKACIPRL